MRRHLRVLRGACASYTRLAWWGLVAPRVSEKTPLRVVQAVIVSESGILLAVRNDLRGWELPGGELEPGEAPEHGVCREVREETGLEVSVKRHVGDYSRTGFRPHTVSVYTCRCTGGHPRTNEETRALRWFPADRLPETLFPWYREPIADALAEGRLPVERHEHQGVAAIAAGMRIDLRMRYSDDDGTELPSRPA